MVESANQSASLEHYYPECLQCRIQSWTPSDDVSVAIDSQCLTLELGCIQLKFSDQETFEDFFQRGQPSVYQLFYKEDGIDQNTLHVILEEYTMEEINREYIESIFNHEPRAYRVLILELSRRDSHVKIQPDLAAITHLAIRIILHCGDQPKPSQTVYLIHNQRITLESKHDNCLSTVTLSAVTTPSVSMMTTIPREVLSVEQEKPNDPTAAIVLFTCIFLSVLVSLIIYCLRRTRRNRRRMSVRSDGTSEETVSEDSSLETPSSLNEKPKFSLKAKPSKRIMRVIQLLDDDL